MSTASLLRLLTLSAIWGSSFMFMRISAPELGPVALMAGRFVSATLFLFVVAVILKRAINLKTNRRQYVVQGLMSSTIPFLMFGFAAQTLPASILSVLNATAPIWGAILGAAVNGHRPTATALLGLVLGICGVGVLVGFDPSMLNDGAGLAALAAVGATMFYSASAIYVQRNPVTDPLMTALGCMLVSTIAVTPVAPFFLPDTMPSPLVIGSVLALGTICSGIAYLIFFRLIADIGPASALTVTFLIPVFGILWGAVFLNEHLGWNTLAGSIIVIIGTALVTGFRPAFLKRRPQVTV